MTRPQRQRLRNSFVHGLAWSYISNSLRDIVDGMKRGSVTVESSFQFPPAHVYPRYELWLRDTLYQLQQAIVFCGNPAVPYEYPLDDALFENAQ